MILARMTPSRLMAQLVSSQEDSMARRVGALCIGAKLRKSAGWRGLDAESRGVSITPDGRDRVHPGCDKGGDYPCGNAGEETDRYSEQDDVQRDDHLEAQDRRKDQRQDEDGYQP